MRVNNMVVSTDFDVIIYCMECKTTRLAVDKIEECPMCEEKVLLFPIGVDKVL